LLNINFIDNNLKKFCINYILNFYFIELYKYQYPDLNFNYLKYITKFWNYTIEYFWIRIKWRGKAFRIRFFKKNSKFTFNFGCSHLNKLIYNKKIFTFSKRHRQNYFCFFLKKENLKNIVKLFTYIKIYNCYTLRGLRVKKKAIIARKGKISQAYSRLHDFH